MPKHLFENKNNNPIQVASFILSQVNMRSVYTADEFLHTSRFTGSVSIICHSQLCSSSMAIIENSVNLIKQAYYNINNKEIDITHNNGVVNITLSSIKDIHNDFPIKILLQTIKSNHEENGQRKLTEDAFSKLMSSVARVNIDHHNTNQNISDNTKITQGRTDNSFVDNLHEQDKAQEFAR